MKSSFQTPNYCFMVDFNDTECAKMVVKNLPVDSQVATWKHGIYFDAKVEAPTGVPATEIKERDVAYWARSKYVCVFFGEVNQEDIPLDEMTIIGHATGEAEGFKIIKSQDDIRLVVIEHDENKEKQVLAYNVPDPNRKLSQSEIDALVAQLLEQKKKEQQ